MRTLILTSDEAITFQNIVWRRQVLNRENLCGPEHPNLFFCKRHVHGGEKVLQLGQVQQLVNGHRIIMRGNGIKCHRIRPIVESDYPN